MPRAAVWGRSRRKLETYFSSNDTYYLVEALKTAIEELDPEWLEANGPAERLRRVDVLRELLHQVEEQTAEGERS